MVQTQSPFSGGQLPGRGSTVPQAPWRHSHSLASHVQGCCIAGGSDFVGVLPWECPTPPRGHPTVLARHGPTLPNLPFSPLGSHYSKTKPGFQTSVSLASLVPPASCQLLCCHLPSLLWPGGSLTSSDTPPGSLCDHGAGPRTFSLSLPLALASSPFWSLDPPQSPLVPPALHPAGTFQQTGIYSSCELWSGPTQAHTSLTLGLHL